jgi:hypothetical protein
VSAACSREHPGATPCADRPRAPTSSVEIVERCVRARTPRGDRSIGPRRPLRAHSTVAHPSSAARDVLQDPHTSRMAVERGPAPRQPLGRPSLAWRLCLGSPTTGPVARAGSRIVLPTALCRCCPHRQPPPCRRLAGQGRGSRAGEVGPRLPEGSSSGAPAAPLRARAASPGESSAEQPSGGARRLEPRESRGPPTRPTARARASRLAGGGGARRSGRPRARR